MSGWEAPGGATAGARVRVALPDQLRALARVTGEVIVEVAEPVTAGAVIGALEARHPVLAGTMRDRTTGSRRAMIRVYAAGEDYSDDWSRTELPAAVRTGREPLRVVGAIAGG